MFRINVKEEYVPLLTIVRTNPEKKDIKCWKVNRNIKYKLFKLFGFIFVFILMI
jgi:hypothetical protein